MTSTRSPLRFWQLVCFCLVWGVFGATELSAQQPDSLVIEAPRDGEQVRTPFTVSGRAPAGAQLELWLGSALERVFRADSNGSFSSAVSDRLDGRTKIWVHQIGEDGKRLASTSVMVSWAGAADERSPELVGRPPEASAALPAAEAQPAANSSTTSDSTALGDGPLPSVEDLNAGPLDEAPEPLSVDELEGPVSLEEAASSNSQADASASTGTEPRPSGKAQPRGVRGLAEAGVGFGGAVAGGFALAIIGGGFGLLLSNDGFAALGIGLIGGMVGWATGIAVGVTLTGRAMRGNGKLWAVITGELLGLVLAGVATDAYYQSGAFGDLFPAITVITLPILGAVLGFELTSDADRFEKRGALIEPYVAPGLNGKAASFGIRARF